MKYVSEPTPGPVDNPTTEVPEICSEGTTVLERIFVFYLLIFFVLDHSHAGFISAIAVLCVVILALVIVIVVLSYRKSSTFKLGQPDKS